MIFFTSDTHFSHDNIRKYCDRPFKNFEEMDETMIKNWNNVVSSEDSVYHLGDVCWWHRNNAKRSKEILYQLNGKIYHIAGNHDKKLFKGIYGKEVRERFEWSKEYKMITIPDEEMDDGIQKIVLFHYPIYEWDCKFHGSFHCFGHVHGTLQPCDIKAVDVSVDSHNFKPVSYEDVKKIITKRSLNKGK